MWAAGWMPNGSAVAHDRKGKKIMATGAIIAGSLISAGVAAHSAHQQRKAAKSAANAAARAASTPVTVSAANEAGQTSSTEANAQKATGERAKRRLTVVDTAQRFAGSGLRKTLN